MSIDMDPRGRYLTVGASDALFSLWDLRELCCMWTNEDLQYQVRVVRFSHDGEYIVAVSEDPDIRIVSTATGKKVHTISMGASGNTAVWHPSRHLLACSADEKDPSTGRYNGQVRVFGFERT